MGDGENRDPGFSPGSPEQPARVQRLSFPPCREPGRGQEIVQADREAEAVLLREEGLQVDHSDAIERRRLDLADEGGEVQVAPFLPGALEEVREEDVLPAAHRIGLDPEKGQQARDGGGDPLPQPVRVGRQAGRRRREGAQQVQWQPGLAARSVDGQVHRGTEPADPGPVLAPPGEPAAPGLGGAGGVVVRAHPLPRRLVLVNPGTEVGGEEIGEGQKEVSQVPLGIDRQGGNAVEGRLLQQGKAEAGLSAAGHPDTDGVGGQVPGVIEEVLLPGGAFLEIEGFPEIEDAELLERFHGMSLRRPGLVPGPPEHSAVRTSRREKR